MIGKMGTSVAALTALAMTVKLLSAIFISKERTLMDRQNLQDLLNAFIIAITIIVVAVPEGLPLAVTISLAFSVAEMADLGNLVRRLSASETMGGANEICTDKTGTLTQNKMTVQALYINDHVVDGDKYGRLMETPTGELLVQSVLYNSSAYVGDKENGLTKRMEKTAIGNVTECGLINYLMKSEVPCEELISHRKQPGFMLFEIPFNSARKRATSVVRLPNGDVRVFAKGAPEIVIGFCDKYHSAEGRVVDLDEKKKKSMLSNQVKQFASKCYRTLLIAYVDYSKAHWEMLESKSKGFEEVEDKEIVE